MKLINIRIDETLLKKAKEKAKLMGRSLSGQIRYLLQKFLEE